MRYKSSHSGMTLIELLIFLAILSIVIAAALPLLFSATENRMLQQTISVVEQNGVQILQNVSFRVRHAERILDPLPGEEGTVLALQTGSGVTNPTIIGASSGSIYIVEHATKERISSSQVAVQFFSVRNTSTSDTNQSVEISYRVSRTVRLRRPHSYAKHFEALLSLFPDDVTTGSACGCAMPSCQGNDVYGWQVCQEGDCLYGTTALDCP